MTYPAEPPWLQHHLHLADPGATEALAAQYLGPALTSLEEAGVVAAWHFLRKGDRWRLRYLLTAPDGASAVDAMLKQCREAAMVTAWTPVIYEPETLAFGGAEGIVVAHRLFHRDSRQILAYLRTIRSEQLSDQRAELSVLLGTAMMRGAGLDWYEIGDTWAKVAVHRPPTRDSGPSMRLRNAVGILLRTDTDSASALLNRGQLSFAREWFTAFTDCGRTLRELAEAGRLHRGLRVILAHHHLFHSNRLGLSHQQQALLAEAATTTVLDLNPEPEAT
ncbi:thiopeptide-type bacteriocin biosynthesis protein [Kitasatospora sp. NPDC057015]|uniref:thiopeptide-type bacteriocin biosynthesis protein n=1 Tax=Kitasatospora sp. NPDC057015 TaxID=3346001 RepID=UPI00363E42B4